MAPRKPNLTARIGAALAAVALVAGLGLSFLSGGGNNAASSTTTSSTTTAAPPSTVVDADFQAVASRISDQIEAASGQRCDLISGFEAFGELPPPAGAVQVATGLLVTAQLLRAMAATTEPDEAEVAATIAATAAAIEAEAGTVGDDPSQSAYSETLNEETFTAAVEAYQQRTAEVCSPAPTDPTTATGGG